MGLFHKNSNNDTQDSLLPPDPNTMGMVLLDRVMEDTAPAQALIQAAFGPDALGDVDRSHPSVTHMTVRLDGVSFWCSYMPFPVPQDEVDIPRVAQLQLLSPDERQSMCDNSSFWLIAQKDGAQNVEEKRRICWVFSRLCAALLQLDGAVGVCHNTTGLLISKKTYLYHADMMARKQWNDPDYFPVPLWIWILPIRQEGANTIETLGLNEFGLPELGFYAPTLPPNEILQYLYTMSSWQITGRQRYRSGALVPLTENLEVVCKQSEGQKLYFFGG